MKLLITAWLKKHLLPVAVACWAALAPIHPAMYAAIAMPLVDLALAIAADLKARKASGVVAMFQVVRSAGLKRTFAKILLWLSGLSLAFVAETYLGLPAAIHVMSAVCGFSELKSCLEHLDDLSGGDFFKAVIARISPDELPPGGPTP